MKALYANMPSQIYCHLRNSPIEEEERGQAICLTIHGPYIMILWQSCISSSVHHPATEISMANKDYWGHQEKQWSQNLRSFHNLSCGIQIYSLKIKHWTKYRIKKSIVIFFLWSQCKYFEVLFMKGSVRLFQTLTQYRSNYNVLVSCDIAPLLWFRASGHLDHVVVNKGLSCFYS